MRRIVPIDEARTLSDCMPGDVVSMNDATWRIFSLGGRNAFVRPYDLETRDYGECTVVEPSSRCRIVQSFLASAGAAVGDGGDPDPLIKL